jgi:hypothetical protein
MSKPSELCGVCILLFYMTEISALFERVYYFYTQENFPPKENFVKFQNFQLLTMIFFLSGNAPLDFKKPEPLALNISNRIAPLSSALVNPVTNR